MKKQLSKCSILLLLVAMFAAPGVAAYFLYQHPTWLGTKRVNKGELLKPPVVLNALAEQKKWRIVFWAPDSCDANCLQQLDTLARMRLALGRKLYQVDQWLILGASVDTLPEATQTVLKNLDYHVTSLVAPNKQLQDTLSANAQVFLADPNNYLVLRYSAPVNPNDVYKDLKLLLNATEKNG